MNNTKGNKLLIFILSLFTMLLVLPVVTNASESSVLTACAEPWPPFDYKENGQIKGSDIEYNQAIFKRLNIPFKVVIMPWKQCWRFVQTGGIDMALMVSKNSLREKDAFYSQKPSVKANFVWVTNDSTASQFICKQSICPDLKKDQFKMGITQGNSYSKDLLNCISKDENKDYIVYQPTQSSAFRALLLDKVQVVPSIKPIAEYFKQKMKIEHLHICQNTLFTKDYYTVFSKKSNFKTDQYVDIKQVKIAFDKASLNINS